DGSRRVGTRGAELAHQPGGHERGVHGEHDRDRARRRTKAGDDAGERGARLGPVVEELEWQLEPVAELANREAVLARLPEGAPGTGGERLLAEPSERLRRSEPGAGATDEQNAGQARTRHGSVYTFRRPPRAKPHTVTPRSAASSTARLE